MEVKIESSWKEMLKSEFEKGYFKQLVLHLKMEKMAGKTIFPPGTLLFNAFEKTPFNEVKAVLIGQDPYHGKGQAHGLSFSVPQGVNAPPSLLNMFKEIETDLGVRMNRDTGDLTPWAKQGVLLLNASLSVREGEPNSHKDIGWNEFTDKVITTLSEQKTGIVFLLWGKFAQQKQPLIDETKHKVLKAAHPSPFSVEKGFYGCKHFSKANEYLISMGKSPIDWKL